MITSILYSSPTFEAVDYNERKVAKGDATLLAVENFGYLDVTKDYSAAHLRQYLVDYSKRNDRIKKPQMHVAFSCRGQEMSTEELVAYARQWLSEMGYADEKQPLLIYSHNDTDNNHIHVITSRINPEGKKINHNHERVRSKAFVERTLGVDTLGELNEVVAKSFEYKFESVGQWRAILESSGYDVAEKDGILKIAKNGAYQHSLNLLEVENRLTKQYEEKNRHKQFRAILLKYRNMSCSQKELQEQMKRKFGVDLVFLGKKDSPRGYLLVDHKEMKVYKGSRILGVDQLLNMETKEDKMKRIDAFIDSQLEEHPRMTGKELHSLLRRYYSASYKKGIVYFGMSQSELKPYMLEAIKYNTKVKFAKGFSCSTQEEMAALCHHFKINIADLPISQINRRAQKEDDLLTISKSIVKLNDTLKARLEAFKANDLDIVYYNNKFFVIDRQGGNISCLDDNGIYLRPEQQPRLKPERLKGMGNNSSSSPQSGGANREFEVGNGGRYDDIDDARKLKR